MNVKLYNGLTGAQLERLAWLLEELGEVQQAIGKIMRHGYDAKNPEDSSHKGNRDDLEREMADVYAAITLMSNQRDISLPNVMNYAFNKTKSRFFHYTDNQQ